MSDVSLEEQLEQTRAELARRTAELNKMQDAYKDLADAVIRNIDARRELVKQLRIEIQGLAELRFVAAVALQIAQDAAPWTGFYRDNKTLDVIAKELGLSSPYSLSPWLMGPLVRSLLNVVGWEELDTGWDEAIERAAKRVERDRRPQWTDEQFETWWTKDSRFVDEKHDWGWFSGTTKEKLLHETKLALTDLLERSRERP